MESGSGLNGLDKIVMLLHLLGMLAVAAPPLTQAQELRRTPIVDVFRRSHNTVVNISSTRTVTPRRSPFELFFDDWKPFFRPARQQLTSVGSGFVIHESGYLVTNAHVVERTSDTKIIFGDDSTYDAAIVAVDHDHDLALLQIEPQHNLQVIELGRSDDLLIGETAIAIGNPLGYQHTLTSGVISATHRELQLFNERTGRTVKYSDLIQTDASINPGNSGGPLLNSLGKLIGINTAIRGDAQNIGFAIPVEVLHNILPNMLLNEQQARYHLGMRVADDRIVSWVQDNGPAQRGGLVIGERITKVGGLAVGSTLDLAFALLDFEPGNRIAFQVQCEDGSVQMKSTRLQQPPPSDGRKLAEDKLGITLAPLTRALKSELNLHRQGGLLIAKVEKSGPAGRVGVKPGDILTVLDRYYVTSLEEAGQLLERTASGDRMRIRILRIEQDVIYRDSATVVLR
jgi:serine protease Do